MSEWMIGALMIYLDSKLRLSRATKFRAFEVGMTKKTMSFRAIARNL